jgi:hypothetical protein
MSQRYALTELGRKSADKFTRGQPALVYDVLYTAETALTAKEVADSISDKLVTRQDPLRVVGFYFSVWKKAGFVNGETDTPVVTSTVETKSMPEVLEAVDKALDDEDNAQKFPAEELAKLGEFVDNTEEPPNLIKNATTLKDAVFEVLSGGLANVPGHISQVLSEQWQPTSVKQVKDTLRKLVHDGEITKQDDGTYIVEA